MTACGHLISFSNTVPCKTLKQLQGQANFLGNRMQIGELARSTDTDVETIRYYEKFGLLTAPPRNGAGYREYGAAHLEQLQFIRHCRSLQISLADIRVLLELNSEPMSGCDRVNALLDHHIDRIRQQMVMLQALESRLTALRQQCSEPNSVNQCAILKSLSGSAREQECPCHIKPE